ncbi:hypothetical protein [Pseudoalteromonas piratica]|uniref:Uncharacterized protein n=1 Tax=Pseudoalteromonas piratica TaxID=1348114 RepID=A0A0A7ELZ2_9GAMM|nr:hypothetical protein [Pseudoalteromonas piratica]AIY67081.1 hypothetical protein OM33_18580 [Pseudoalteromonas piratica]
MDLLIFSVSSLLQLYTDSVHDHFTDIYGAEMKTKTVQYQGHNISYSYHLWKLKSDSVCANKKQDFTNYSSCTVSAQSLFNDICQHLEMNPKQGWRYTKTKNMYCNASLNYKPVIAQVSFSTGQDNKELEKACSTAILRYMQTNHDKDKNIRDEVCAKAKKSR